MKSLRIGDKYVTEYAGRQIVVEVVRIIDGSGTYRHNWDLVCCVGGPNGLQTLRRCSELEEQFGC